jgi:hypothetical protein
MWRKILVVAAGVAVAASGVTGAMAGASTDINERYSKPSTYSAPQHRHRHSARREFAHGVGATAFRAVRPRVSIFRGPSYLYLPRTGIVDEACNLPTSACPNEMRDVR